MPIRQAIDARVQVVYLGHSSVVKLRCPRPLDIAKPLEGVRVNACIVPPALHCSAGDLLLAGPMSLRGGIQRSQVAGRRQTYADCLQHVTSIIGAGT